MGSPWEIRSHSPAGAIALENHMGQRPDGILTNTGRPHPGLRQLEAYAVISIAQAIKIPFVDGRRSKRRLALAEEECEGIWHSDEEMHTAGARPWRNSG